MVMLAPIIFLLGEQRADRDRMVVLWRPICRKRRSAGSSARSDPESSRELKRFLTAIPGDCGGPSPRYYGVVTEAVLTAAARGFLDILKYLARTLREDLRTGHDTAPAMPALAENPIWRASWASMMIQNQRLSMNVPV